MSQSYSLAEGDTVKLEGIDAKRRRVYIGRVIKSQPNEIIVQIGDKWTNRYLFQNGEWVGQATKKGLKVPKARVIGLIASTSNTESGV